MKTKNIKGWAVVSKDGSVWEVFLTREDARLHKRTSFSPSDYKIAKLEFKEFVR